MNLKPLEIFCKVLYWQSFIQYAFCHPVCHLLLNIWVVYVSVFCYWCVEWDLQIQSIGDQLIHLIYHKLQKNSTTLHKSFFKRSIPFSEILSSEKCFREDARNVTFSQPMHPNKLIYDKAAALGFIQAWRSLNQNVSKSFSISTFNSMSWQ